MLEYEARRGIGGWIEEEEEEEEEPIETHWDVGTQTEEEEPKKPIGIKVLGPKMT